jgi:hypothetical protein
MEKARYFADIHDAWVLYRLVGQQAWVAQNERGWKRATPRITRRILAREGTKEITRDDAFGELFEMGAERDHLDSPGL